MKKLPSIILFTLFFVSTTNAFYSDVDMQSILYPPIKYLSEKKVVKGYADGSFGVAKPINRAEALKIILTAADIPPSAQGINSFPDVPADTWFASFVAAAKEKKIVSGDAATGNFLPARQVTRAEFLKMTLQAFQVNLADYKIEEYPLDVPKDAWFRPYMSFAAQYKIVPTNKDGTVNPSQPVTRGEATYLLYKTLEKGQGLDPQLLLNLMDRHMGYALQSLSDKNFTEAAFSAGTARTYGQTLQTFMKKNKTVEAAVYLAEAVNSIVGAHISAENIDMNAVIIASKNAWSYADKAQQADSAQTAILAGSIKKLSEGLATTAREILKKEE